MSPSPEACFHASLRAKTVRSSAGASEEAEAGFFDSPKGE